MKIMPYEPKVHESEVKKMLISRYMPTYLVDDLPLYGLIAIEKDVPVAVGFIRQIEGFYAMLDSYMTNAESSPELRDRALDLITGKLLRWAKDANVSKVLAFSADTHIQIRAEAHGFDTFKDHIFQMIRFY